MVDPRTICRVCGHFEKGIFPFGEDGLNPSWDICACCGVEHGYGDCQLIAIEKFRGNWIASGLKWHSQDKKPMNWNLEDQLKLIPKIGDPQNPYL